jgi:hypothetical protein
MEKLQLQKLRITTHEHALTNQQETKEQYDKRALPHTFQIGDKVLIANDFDTTKNPKLVPNWKVLAEIIDINDTNAKVKLKNKIKVLNVSKLKHFFKNVEKSEDEEDDASKLFNQSNNQAQDFSDIFNQAHHHQSASKIN